MSMSCATHPDAASSGRCSLCGKPFCAVCEVEDVAGEASFCSHACRDLEPRGPAVGGRSNDELLEGLAHPIRTGWALCSSLAWPLTRWVALPVGLGYSLFEYATQGLLVDPETGISQAGVLGFLLACVVAAPAVAVLLSRSHALAERGNPWPHVGPRYPAWFFTMLLFVTATALGTLAMIIPGLILGIRLFWADEFALVHGHDPMSALRESMNLTRGLTGRVFGFQFLLGLAEYLVLLPVVMGIVAVELMLGALPLGPAGELLANLLLSTLFVVAYASAHAAEVVYFYGLRALRAELPAEALRGDWVARGLRERGRPAAGGVHACPTCGTHWEPADYQADAEFIFCSTCRTQLQPPA